METISITRISAGGFYSIKEEWNTLVNDSTNNNIFLTWEWLKCWWHAFESPRREFYFLTARTDGGQLVGAFPLQVVRQNHRGLIPLRILLFLGRGGDILPGGTEYNTFMMPPILPGFERSVISAMACYLEAHTNDWDTSYLGNLISDHLLSGILENELGKKFPVNRYHQENNYVMKLAGTYEEHLAGLNKKQRYNFNSSTKKIAINHHLEISLLTDTNKTVDFLKSYFFLVRRRHNWTPSERRLTFMFDLCKELQKAAWLRCYLLSLNGNPAATVFGFAYNKKFYIYKSAFDPAYYSESPGTALSAHVVKDAIAEGLQELDFLIGKYDYKRHWSNHVRKVIGLNFNNGTFSSRLKLAIGEKLDRIINEVKQRTKKPGVIPA